LWLNGAS